MKKVVKYLERMTNQEDMDKKVQEQTCKRSKLQGQADLLEVESQISEKEASLETLRSKQGDYSLTSVGECMLQLTDLHKVYSEMKYEFAAEFEI